VLGAGVAGMSVALVMARAGHQVDLVERDTFCVGDPELAPAWARKGIPHFLQPHAFIPRGRTELIQQLPDVYQRLLAAGAEDVDMRPKIPGPVEPADAELQYMAVRRPLIEWALRRAISLQAGIEVHGQSYVQGVQTNGARVTGVRVSGGTAEADLVVDCLGRHSHVSGWLKEAGMPADSQISDCGVIYYSRYYQCRPGFELPDGPWFLSPRGDLGYLGYATFPGDNATFAAVLAVPTGVPEWRAFRHAGAFEAAVSRIPALAAWVNPDGVDPITDVMAMAGLHNSISLNPRPPGLVSAGDAYSHTDPVLAHGLAFAIIHAAASVAALAEHQRIDDACLAYDSQVRIWARERYELATALDEQRLRLWQGQPVTFAHPQPHYALFSVMAAAAAASLDPGTFRLYIRRIGLLDSTTVFDHDTAAQHRVEELFQRFTATPRAAQGPTRDEMLHITNLSPPT
jgi:2-polyprenyl-6-methoxyphenol hydroxylase-like FAD-dependent oxidoreductase